MKKKLLVGILVLTMLVACLGITASAAAPEIKTEQALIDAIAKVEEGGTVKLDGDITLTKTLNIENGVGFTLDLNGYKIKGQLDSTPDPRTYVAFTTLITIKTKAAGGSGVATKLTITDNSASTKGGIEAVGATGTKYNKVIDISSTYSTAIAELTLSEGISVELKSATGTAGGAIVASGHSKVTINKANVTSSTIALSGISSDTLAITDGVFKGTIKTSWKEATVNGGSFSDESVRRYIPDGKAFVPDADSDGMYKVGTFTQDDKDNAEAKVRLGSSEGSDVYGTLQELFKYYGTRDKDIEILKDATLKLDKYGDVIGNKYDTNNTLKIKAADGKTVKVTITGTVRVAKIKYIADRLTLDTTGLKTVDGFATVTAVDDAGYKVLQYDAAATNDDYVVEVDYDGTTLKYPASALSNLLMNLSKNYANEEDKVVTIKLLKDITTSYQTILAGNVNLKLDLNGHTYTYNGAATTSGSEGGAAFILAGGTEGAGAMLTVAGPGTLDCSKSDMAISVGDFKNATAANKAVIEDDATVKGTVVVLDKGELEVSGTIEAQGFAITGNGAHDGTTITINDSAVVKSATTAAVYHPQGGTLTIGENDTDDAAPHIEGKAGVVARDGKVTVHDADIVATGTGNLKIGDAETTVPAGGIVLDNAKGYGTSATMDVQIEDANVEAANGQPAVSYTENGKAPTTMPTTPEITVKGGTYSNAPDSSFLDSSLTSVVTGSDGTTSSYFKSPAAAEQYAQETGGQVAAAPVKTPATTTPANLKAVGYIPEGLTKEEAVAMVEKLLPTGMTVADIPTDLDAGYFFAIVTGSTANKTTPSNYDVTFTFGTNSHNVTAIGVSVGKVVCFKPSGTEVNDINEVKEGKYTVTLNTAGQHNGNISAPFNIYKVTYRGTTGVTMSKPYEILTNASGVEDALKAVPSVFTLDAGVNKWTTGIEYPGKGEYVYTVTIGGVYSAPIDPEHECPTKGFKDMEILDTSKLWYHEAMDYMVLNGYIHGFDDGTLQPNGVATRAQMLVIMAQTKGVSVAGDPWYKAAVAWASDPKRSYSDGLRPEAPIQREEVVTILWRIAGKPASTQKLDKYDDAASVNEWAKTAMAWAVEKGIMTGRDNNLVPQGTATRAELARFIFNYLTVVK